MSSDPEEANVRCTVPRPDYARETDPGTHAFKTTPPETAELDPAIVNRNCALIDALMRKPTAGASIRLTRKTG